MKFSGIKLTVLSLLFQLMTTNAISQIQGSVKDSLSRPVPYQLPIVFLFILPFNLLTISKKLLFLSIVDKMSVLS